MFRLMNIQLRHSLKIKLLILTVQEIHLSAASSPNYIKIKIWKLASELEYIFQEKLSKDQAALSQKILSFLHDILFIKYFLFNCVGFWGFGVLGFWG